MLLIRRSVKSDRQYELVERVKSYDTAANEDALNKAYVFSMKAHGSQRRASAILTSLTPRGRRHFNKNAIRPLHYHNSLTSRHCGRHKCDGRRDKQDVWKR